MPVTRIAAAAIFDPRHQWVEVGGQVFAGERGAAGVSVLVRGGWGGEVETVSSTLGSFGVRLRAGSDSVGMEVTLRAAEHRRVFVVR